MLQKKGTVEANGGSGRGTSSILRKEDSKDQEESAIKHMEGWNWGEARRAPMV